MTDSAESVGTPFDQTNDIEKRGEGDEPVKEIEALNLRFFVYAAMGLRDTYNEYGIV